MYEDNEGDSGFIFGDVELNADFDSDSISGRVHNIYEEGDSGFDMLPFGSEPWRRGYFPNIGGRFF